ncbi:hypothetical protein MKW94_009889 [Papaver nudicaule]|uniref:Protection of telomeres protein 1 n=1 Tax=Papaver nudicaule TaxID=74823 RepID=A0AA41VE26_PAPNU|nr:hypothetical protein [Papaver nudicaule]
MYLLQIIDATYFAEAISVNIFDSIENLPSVQSFGDILVITGVKITRRNDNRPSISVKKRDLSYALFHLNDTEPYHSCLSRHFLLDNNEFIQNFRVHNSAVQFCPGNTYSARNISHMKDGIPMDLICKVLYVRKETYWELFVWDGTNAPTLKLQTQSNEIRKWISKFAVTPNAGTIVQIFVPSSDFNEHLVIGMCVKLYDVTITSSSSCGFLSEKSKIRFLSDMEFQKYLRLCPCPSNTPVMGLPSTEEVSYDVPDATNPSTTSVMCLANIEEVSHNTDHDISGNTNRTGRNPDRKKNGPGKRERKRVQAKRQRQLEKEAKEARKVQCYAGSGQNSS